MITPSPFGRGQGEGRAHNRLAWGWQLIPLLLLAMSTAQAAEPARIPLVAGLSVTTAIAEPSGDYESRKRLLERAGAGWRMRYNTEQVSASGKIERYESERLIHDADLATARSYRSRFEANTEEDYPGTTALGASALVLQDLRSSGKSRFTLVGEDRFIATALAAVPGAKASVLDLAGALMAGSGLSFKGELQRKSSGQLSVLVNGVAHALPVLVASGRFVANNGQSMDAELSLLDDLANPLALQWRIGNSQLRAVRIDYPAPAASLATAFQQQKRVVLPGLYFDFGSAVLRAESTAALPAILEAIRSAPKAQLLLEGHTDVIGDASRNQALSLARAQAVRSALIARDATLAPRLSARGLGSAKPIASNNTLEGRAQNRRVELVARVSHGGIE